MLLNLVFLLGILDTELRSLLLVQRLLLLAFIAILLSHAGLDLLRTRRDVVSTQCTVLHLFLILLLDTTYLVDCYTALH